MVRKMTLREIKGYVSTGAAEDLTNLSFKEMDDFLFTRPGLEKIAFSTGIYGVNSLLFCDPVTGELFAITKRSTALFQVL